MKNYLIYPCKTLRITQTYTGNTSHLPHTTGYPEDYPWDEGCDDSGRSWCFCPCDEMIIKRIYGVSSNGVNTIWLESTTKVDFADETKGYFVMLITHPNDDDLKKIKVGQVFKRGEKICREGIDGATGYHFHFSGGKGKYKGNGWIQNTKGKYVLTTTDKTFKPEKLFFIDPDFTKVISTKGLKFKELPPKYTKGTYIITAERLNVRTGAGEKYAIIPYSKFKISGKNQIKKLMGAKYKENHFVKGMKLSISKVEDNWGKCPTGWVCLDYCKKIK